MKNRFFSYQRRTCYFFCGSSESITDGKGNILVPIEEVIRYRSLEELREKCGDSLVLVTDENGYVTFVGGHFTDVLVSDENDSIEAIECMLDLIGFQEGKILRFSQSVEDASDVTDNTGDSGSDTDTGLNQDTNTATNTVTSTDTATDTDSEQDTGDVETSETCEDDSENTSGDSV